MIRIDAMWLAVEPVDMRSGADRLIARVVEVFGAARAHHGYLFANARGTRVKLVLHDGLGRPAREAIRRCPDDGCGEAADNARMLDAHTLNSETGAKDLKGLSKGAMAELTASLLAQLAARDEQLSAQQAALEAKDEHIARCDSEIKFKDAKIERITFELARLKAWKFGAKTETMNAEQRQMFEDTLAEDEADLEARLRALQGDAEPADKPQAKRKPRRQALPEHLRRVEHHHEPEDTTCPTPDCGQPMVRIGEDVSERLDIVPAEFFVHRHIRGKWVCKCCQHLVQEPVEPQIIDKGVPTAGLVAHTLVAHFVDHLPYYRLEQINARSGVHTPRSTLASWSGAGGASLTPLYEAHRAFVLSAKVLHADETPVRMLDPGAGKTAKAYVWAYARGEHDGTAGVIYDFCTGRGSKYRKRLGTAGQASCWKRHRGDLGWVFTAGRGKLAHWNGASGIAALARNAAVSR